MLIIDFIDQHRSDYGVEPICRALQATTAQIALSTYWAAKTRPPSAKSLRDAELTEKIHRVHEENYGVYGARKFHAHLQREGVAVARCSGTAPARRRAAWGFSSEGPQGQDSGSRPGAAPGSGAARFHGQCPGSALGR